MRWCGAVLVVLGACTLPHDDPDSTHPILQVDELSPLAVGSTTRLSVVDTDCGLFVPPGATCPAPPEDVGEGRVEPAGSFEVTRTDAAFDVTATAPAVAGFYVDVTWDGQPVRLGYNLVAETIDTVSLQTTCASPAVMPVRSEMAFDFEMRHGDDALHGQIMPFTITGAQLTPPDRYGVPWLKLPATPGTVTITSPYDPAFAYEIDVVDAVDPASIDGIAITDPPSPLEPDATIEVRADLFVGARHVCDRMPITTTISTPEHCAFDPGAGGLSDRIWIRGIAAGACTVQVTLAGTAVSTTKTFPVM